MLVGLTRASATRSCSSKIGGLVAVAVASFVLPVVAQAQTLSPGEPAGAFDVTNFLTGLTNPTDITFLPDGRAVVTSKTGNVIVRKTDGTPMTAGRITTVPLNASEQGLLGVVADPAFATNKTLYFYASQGPTAEAKHRVLKITLGDDNVLAVPGTILVDQDPARMLPGLQGPANHNGGGMVIYKNQLYYGVGDTGANATPPQNKNGTCLNVPNGKISRVNLDGSVPADNPLVGMNMVTGCADRLGALAATFRPDTRIYAWGFRNPWRFWIDSKTGKLWVGDVGETTQEEIGVGGKGDHFGWPFVEGTRVYTANGCMGITPAKPCTPPVHTYPHANGDNSVTGGLIPEGCGWAAPWSNRYFFSDHGSGRTWTLDVNAARDGVMDNSLKIFSTGGNPASLRQGLDHALYIVSHDSGSVARFAPKGLAAMNCPMAAVPGGDGNGGGTGGAGGAVGTGGTVMPGSGGAGGGAGAPGTGGAGPGTGGSNGSGGAGLGSGGTPGGTGGAATGTGGTAPGAAGSSGGCGCDVGGGLPAGLSLSALALLALGLTVRRRRARNPIR